MMPRTSFIPWLTAAILIGAMSCRPESHPQAFADSYSLEELIEVNLSFARDQALLLDRQCPDSLFPRTYERGEVKCSPSWAWTSGFFIGTLWQLYEAKGEEVFKNRAWARSQALKKEQFSTFDHDLGFRLYNSFGRGLRLTGDSSFFVPVLVQGARSLVSRFDPRVGAIMSWNPNPSQGWQYPVIIDNMMNLEYLCWASRATGDSSFLHVALSHADKTLENHFRTDNSSYHVISYDSITGSVDKRSTAQGLGDESAWARGQAWGLYGFTMMYRETLAQRYLDQAQKIADFFLSHPNLPQDMVPYWDFDSPAEFSSYRDASAAAIAASALLELSQYVDTEPRHRYLSAARTMLRSLSSPAYRSATGANGGFFLLHGVGSIPHKSEVDVPLSYADYYYLEALMRLKKLIEGRELVDP